MRGKSPKLKGDDYAGIAMGRPSSSEGAFLQLGLLGLRGQKIAEGG